MQGWNRLDAEQGEFVDVVPAQQWLDDETWYQGTADAVHQSLDIIESYQPEYVLILAGDHIYNMDYGEMLAAHVEAGADFTIACNSVPRAEATGFGVMQINEDGRIINFEEKPDNPKPIPEQTDHALVSMGIYVASLKYLREQLKRDAEDTDSDHDFGKNIIPDALDNGDFVKAYMFSNPARGAANYWRDVGTIDAYYEASLEIIRPDPPLDIYDPSWPISTYQPQLPPAQFSGSGRMCRVENAMVSGGCVIESSNLDTSVLYSNVKVHADCDLQGVLALPGCEIGAGSRLKGAILDNKCNIPAGSVIGEDSRKDKQRFHISEGGVVVVNRTSLGQGDSYQPNILTEPASDSGK